MRTRGQVALTAEQAIQTGSLLTELGAQADLLQGRSVLLPVSLTVQWQGRRAVAHYGNEAEAILQDVRNDAWRFPGWYTPTD